MISNIILVVVIAVISMWMWVMNKYSYFRIRNIQYVKPKFPLGNLNGLGQTIDMFTWINQLYFKFNHLDILGGIFIGTVPTIIATGPDVIQDILIRDFSKFSDSGFYMNEKHDPLSAHLYSLQGEKWRNIRTKISPTFSVSNIGSMFENVKLIGQDLITFMDRFVLTGKPFNAKNISMRYICDTIGSFAFGLDCKALTEENPVLLELAEELFPPKKFFLLSWFLSNSYQRIASRLRVKVFPTKVTKYFKQIIDETVEFRERNNVEINDFMNLLITIKKKGCLMEDESGEVIGKITYNELAAQAFVMFFAGFHMSRITLTFALFELALQQEIQQRARREILDKMVDGEITYSALNEMSYLQQVVDETLRKYPPTGYLQRRASEDYKVRNSEHVIDKGTSVFIPIFGIHYDPTYYPDPYRFDPDRMTTEKMNSRHPSTFLPFGGGPRICIGQRFGYLQVKLALALLLTKFRFTINSKTKQPLAFDPLACDMDVTEGIWLDLQPV